MTCFHFCQHLLGSRTLKIGTGVSIVYKEHRIGKVMFSCILQENGLLILNGERFSKTLVFL